MILFSKNNDLVCWGVDLTPTSMSCELAFIGVNAAEKQELFSYKTKQFVCTVNLLKEWQGCDTPQRVSNLSLNLVQDQIPKLT